MTDLANIVTMTAPTGKAELLGAALTELVTLTRQEAGCAVCELNQALDDPQCWMVYERWHGKEAFELHMEQPYVARFLAQMGDLLSEPAQVRPFKFRG